MHLLCILFLPIILLSMSTQARSKSIHIGLHAAWQNTRQSAEAAVWLSQTFPNSLLPFLNALHTSPHPSNDLQSTLFAFDSLFTDTALRATFRSLIHARIFSPSVNTHYALARQSLDALAPNHPTDIFAIRVHPLPTSTSFLHHPNHLSDSSQSPILPNAPPFAKTLPADISIFHSCPPSLPKVFIYADLLSPNLHQWIQAATERASRCTENYYLRFWRLPASQERKPSLQGFQVHVALKSTEYKVVDDRHFIPLFDECGYAGCTNHTSHHTIKWPQLSKHKPTYTGRDLLMYITGCANAKLQSAIDCFQTVVEDAPSIIRSDTFAKLRLQKGAAKLASSVDKFRARIGPTNFLFINGRSFGVDTLREDFPSLFRCLSTITSSSMALRNIAPHLPHLPLTQPPEKLKSDLRIDLGHERLLKTSLVWFNDLSLDDRYKRWQQLDISHEQLVSKFSKLVNNKRGISNDLSQLVKVRSNHLSMVVIIDPADPEQFMYLSLPESVVAGNIPIRIGMTLVPNGHVSSMIAACFYHFINTRGSETASQFLGVIRQLLDYMGGSYQLVQPTEQIVEIAFQQVAKDIQGGKYGSANDVLADHDVKLQLEESVQFAERHALFTDDPGAQEGAPRKMSMLVVLNGLVVKDVNSEVISFAVSEQRRIAKLLSSKNIPEEQGSLFETWVSSDPQLIVVNGIRKQMGGATSGKKSKDVTRLSGKHLFSSHPELGKIEYIDGESGPHARLVTVWLSGTDRESDEFKRAETILRNTADSSFASRAKARFAVLPPHLKLNKAILKCDNEEICPDRSFFIINGRAVMTDRVRDSGDLKVEVGSDLQASPVDSGRPDEKAASQQSALEDLLLLQTIANEDISSSCESVVKPRGEQAVDYMHVVDAMTSFNLSGITFTDKSDSDLAWDASAPISILGVVDPTNPNAHIVSAVLSALRTGYSNEDLAMKLLIAPDSKNMMKHFDLPSTFSKFLISSDFSKTQVSDIRTPQVAFHLLPQHRVLTVGVKPPRAWFVSSYSTNYDMDNVVLDSLPEASEELHAEYELNNLIVEGSCIDENEAPPQGLKLILENDSGVSVDTVVMANLGYFQLKVPTPGRWNLFLAAGPSSNIFLLKSMDMYKDGIRTSYKVDDHGRVPILVDSLSGAGGILLHVERKPGMENSSLLESKPEDNSEPPKGVMGSLKVKLRNLVEGAMKKKSQPSSTEAIKEHADTIHVFSVASGHLYERFLKIMMSSVTKHASRPVKFWLLENYLSPSFKKMLPHFAKAMGCEIGMVTYRWPGWLRAQTEKQRIIWAYKILFLDVLFPLDVNRIIFVDSDQVVRGDLGELMDIDLEGAPYGYVPFCDSREDVEGYRFWKTGFWKDTLRGAKYRISALYVVDLARFRETEAGDTLRYIYQTLSADPNSLSNLDQDLPNYASVSTMGNAKAVPIFDLPQDWLWCETWCDDASKETAKTIDLCNNPKTKEPKLASARRIVAEWEDYDNTASKLTEEIYSRLDKSGGSYGDNLTCSSSDKCGEDQGGQTEEKTEL